MGRIITSFFRTPLGCVAFGAEIFCMSANVSAPTSYARGAAGRALAHFYESLRFGGGLFFLWGVLPTSRQALAFRVQAFGKTEVLTENRKVRTENPLPWWRSCVRTEKKREMDPALPISRSRYDKDNTFSSGIQIRVKIRLHLWRAPFRCFLSLCGAWRPLLMAVSKIISNFAM